MSFAALEPDIYETVSFRPRESAHWLPIGIAILLYSIYHGIGTWRAWRTLSKSEGSSHAA